MHQSAQPTLQRCPAAGSLSSRQERSVTHAANPIPALYRQRRCSLSVPRFQATPGNSRAQRQCVLAEASQTHSHDSSRRDALLLGVGAAAASSFAAPSSSLAEPKEPSAKNVLGGKLQLCCTQPMTGFYRDGYCRVGPEDRGVHSVCSQVTQEFLDFSASRGNDLRNLVSAGERWCLCVSRWKEALDAGKAPPVILESCAEQALDVVSLDQLKKYAL